MKKQVITILLVIIFTTELAVMKLFDNLFLQIPEVITGIVDATVLVLLIAYPVWLICVQFSKQNRLPSSDFKVKNNQNVLLFSKILLTTFLIQFCVMLLLLLLPNINGIGLALVDAFLTILFVLPLFWILLSKEEEQYADAQLSDIFGKPFMVFILLLYMVFIADIIQEIVQPYLTPAGYEEYFIIIDSILTTLIIAPFFWLVIGRPLSRSVESEKNRAKTVLDQLVEAVVSIDGTGHIVSVNPAAERIFDLKLPDIIGQSVDILLAEGQKSIQKLILEQKDQLSQSPEIKLNEVLCKTRKGMVLIMSLSLSRPKNISLDEWILILHDITRHKDAERAMRERDERFRQIFEQTNDAIAFFKPQTCKIIDVNKTFSELFGYSKEKILKMEIDELVAEKDRNRVRMTISETDTTINANLENFIGLDSSHKEFNLSMHTKLMTIDGIDIIYCSVRDITNRLRLEKEATEIQARLIQANKMTSLGLMVSSVAHEINNPNNFISANAILLNNCWDDVAKILHKYYLENGDFYLGGISYSELEKQAPQLFSGILDGSRRINEIVNELKSFYRSDKVIEESININKVAESAVSLLRHELIHYTKNFQLNLGDNLPTVSGNSQQLGQVIINLLMNACQALPDTKCGIWLETSYNHETDEVTLKVIDEGRGMSENDSQKIMDPFFTTKIDSGGTGLGLTICRSIILGHRGNLDFFSVPGKGSTFIVRLPADRLPTQD